MMKCVGKGHRTAVIILAAGLSKRFGSNKLITPLLTKPLVRYAIDNALSSEAYRVVVVVDDLNGPVARICPPVAHMVLNPNPSRGIASSIVAGIESVQNHSCSSIILAGDQPLVSSKLLNSLIEKHKSQPEMIISCRHSGTARNPALFPGNMYGKLRALRGDAGARRLIVKAGVSCSYVDVDDDSWLVDVDSEQDIQRVASLIANPPDQ